MSRQVCIFIAAVLIVAPAVSAGDGIMVKITSAPCPWADTHLEEVLGIDLSTITTVPVIWLDSSDSLLSPVDPQTTFSDLAAYGRRFGGRYLVEVMIDRIDLEKRKKSVIPLLLFRYRVYGVMTGTLRIIDVEKERLVDMQALTYEIEAACQVQVFDDDEDDPALLLPPDDKMRLFRRLDERAAAGICVEIRKLTRGAFLGG